MAKPSFVHLFRVLFALCFAVMVFSGAPDTAEAKKLRGYSDTISDSHPGSYANHTFKFTVLEEVPAGSTIELDFPADFSIMTPTTTFDAKNIELYDDGILRDSDDVGGPNTDQSVVVPGAGGSITYNLNPTTGISSGSEIRILIGNQTSQRDLFSQTVSTSTGTTTTYADVEPIQNSITVGTHKIPMTISNGSVIADGEFNIAVVRNVYATGDSTETVPPYRFNPAPTSTVGGTTLFVEISLETDELAVCKYDSVASTSYAAMPNTFGVTGLIIHSSVVPVVLGTINTYYVRCIDDEGNFNTDDFLIAFSANDAPTGSANEDGDVEGSGTGSGNDGTGDGSGGGGNTGGTEGNASTEGDTSGTGGSGGGSGGSKGEDDDSGVGGGLETSDAEYESGDAEVRISGYAFPGSKVYALVDGGVADSTRAKSDGSYEVVIEDIARGVYTFGVYAVDDVDVKSSTFSTSFTVTGGRVSTLSNINVMPSIKVDPDPVDPGQTLTISGYSIPNADIDIENQKEGSATIKSFDAVSDGDGFWSVTVDTNGFSRGTYKVRAKATQAGGVKTNFSGYTFYGVGENADIPLNADLNRDGSVNLTDFSILLFWWGGDGGDSDPPADINRDGSVSLTDFSIMLFQWTG